jgi:hypothetical protein
MDSLSCSILTVLLPFSVLFSKPSWKKALILLLGTLLYTGKRTVCAALRAMGLERQAVFSNYRHLLNRVEWSSLKAAKILFFTGVTLSLSSPNAVLDFQSSASERNPNSKARRRNASIGHSYRGRPLYPAGGLAGTRTNARSNLKSDGRKLRLDRIFLSNLTPEFAKCSFDFRRNFGFKPLTKIASDLTSRRDFRKWFKIKISLKI